MKMCKQNTFILIFVIVFAMSACAAAPPAENQVVQRNLSEIHAQRTLDAANAAHQATQAMNNWNATVEAKNRIEQTQSVQNTQRVATAQAQNAASTATVQAMQIQATATAHVQATQYSLSVQQTQNAINAQGTLEANNIAAAKRVQEAEVELAELAIERARVMNEIAAVIPYLAGMIGFIILSALLYRWGTNEADRRKIFTDREGVPQGMVDVSHRGVSFTRADRMPSPVIQFNAQGQVIIPQIENQALQGQITMLALLQGALASGKNPHQIISDIQELIQVPQLPQGQIIDVQMVDVSNQTVEKWMTDVEGDFVDGDEL